MIATLALVLLVLAGCHSQPSVEETETSTDVTHGLTEAPGPSRQARDAISLEFQTRPDIVLDRMQPNDPKDIEVATALLESARGEAKLKFAHYLISQGVRSVPGLLTLVRENEDQQTLVAAIQSLGKLKSTNAVDDIAQRLGHENTWIRIVSAHALGDIAGDAAIPSLVTALKDTADTVVSAALIGLGKAGDVSALPACTEMLRHPNPRVRASAVSALGRLGGDQQIVVLQSVKNDSDSGVRFKVGQAIDRLRKKAGGDREN